MQIRREQNRKIAKQPYITQSKTGRFLSKMATLTRLCSVISIKGKVVRGYVSRGPEIFLICRVYCTQKSFCLYGPYNMDISLKLTNVLEI